MKDKIAVIGISSRFVNSSTPLEYWSNLVNKRTIFTGQQIVNNNISLNLSLKNHQYFDNSFWKITEKETSLIDPQSRVLLEEAYKALETSGYIKDLSSLKVGSYINSNISTYLLSQLHNKDYSIQNLNVLLGNDKDYKSSFLAYHLNLKGPAINIQSACSSSFSTLHYAISDVINENVDLALVGAVSVNYDNHNGYSFISNDIYSKDGFVRVFDENSTGTIFSDAVICIVIKKLYKAILDGDDIISVIDSTAINNDGGEKKSYTSTSSDSQVEIFNDLLYRSKLNPENIDFFESHGTGTHIGDTIELESIKRIFYSSRKKKLRLGAVKTLIGHTDNASGLASLLKVSLMFRFGYIPGNNNVVKPHRLLKDMSDYISYSDHGRKEIINNVMINCLGMGGTNTGVILKNPITLDLKKHVEDVRRFYPILLSSKSKIDEQDYIKKLQSSISVSKKDQIKFIFESLNNRRNVFDNRAFLEYDQVSNSFFSHKVFNNLKEEDKIVFNLQFEHHNRSNSKNINLLNNILFHIIKSEIASVLVCVDAAFVSNSLYFEDEIEDLEWVDFLNDHSTQNCNSCLIIEPISIDAIKGKSFFLKSSDRMTKLNIPIDSINYSISLNYKKCSELLISLGKQVVIQKIKNELLGINWKLKNKINQNTTGNNSIFAPQYNFEEKKHELNKAQKMGSKSNKLKSFLVDEYQLDKKNINELESINTLYLLEDLKQRFDTELELDELYNLSNLENILNAINSNEETYPLLPIQKSIKNYNLIYKDYSYLIFVNYKFKRNSYTIHQIEEGLEEIIKKTLAFKLITNARCDKWKVSDNLSSVLAIQEKALEADEFVSFYMDNFGDEISSHYIKAFIQNNVTINQIYFVFDHLLFDYTSIQIFLSKFIDYIENKNTLVVDDGFPNYLVGYDKYLHSNQYKLDSKYWYDWMKEKNRLFSLKNKFNPVRNNKKLSLIINKNEIQNLLEIYHVSEFVVFISIFYYLLSKFSGNKKELVGTAISSRDKSNINSIGLFINVLYLFFDFDKIGSNEDIVRDLKTQYINIVKHKKFPLLQEANSCLESETNLKPDVFFIYQGNIGQTLLDSSDKHKVEFLENKFSKYDFTFSVEKMNSYFKIEIDYNPINYFINDQNFNKFIYEGINYLTYINLDHDKTQLKTNPIIDRIEELSSIYGSKEALIDKTIAISYKDLLEKVYYLANLIGEEKNEGTYLLYMCSSIDLIATILALWYLNKSFIILDPQYHASSVADFIINFKPIRVISRRKDLDSRINNPLIVDFTRIKYSNKVPKHTNYDKNNSAYLVYTSGSTGEPKCVNVPHKKLYSTIMNQINFFDLGHEEKILQWFSPSFDAFFSEVFMGLLSGASVILSSKELFNIDEDFNKTIEECNPNIITVTPSFYSLYSDKLVKVFDKIIFAGEKLEGKIIKYKHGIKYYNAYGPSECTICTSIYKISEQEKGNIPIGAPLKGVKYKILDSETSDNDSIGELAISTKGMATSYIENGKNISLNMVNYDGEYYYPTGDIVKKDKKGQYYFQHRKDREIKARGYRINLDSLQTMIKNYTQAESCIVDYDNNVLAANIYNVKYTEEKIANLLRMKLPLYMHPDIINISKCQLLDNNFKASSRKSLLIWLKDLWKKILNLDCSISYDDDFFELGGKSINILHLSKKFLEKGIEIEPFELIKNRTFSQQLKLIKNTNKNSLEFNLYNPFHKRYIDKYYNSINNEFYLIEIDLFKKVTKLEFKLIFDLLKNQEILRFLYQEDGSMFESDTTIFSEYNVDNYAEVKLDINHGPICIFRYLNSTRKNILQLIIHRLYMDKYSIDYLVTKIGNLLSKEINIDSVSNKESYFNFLHVLNSKNSIRPIEKIYTSKAREKLKYNVITNNNDLDNFSILSKLIENCTSTGFTCYHTVDFRKLFNICENTIGWLSGYIDSSVFFNCLVPKNNLIVLINIESEEDLQVKNDNIDTVKIIRKHSGEQEFYEFDMIFDILVQSNCIYAELSYDQNIYINNEIAYLYNKDFLRILLDK